MAMVDDGDSLGLADPYRHCLYYLEPKMPDDFTVGGEDVPSIPDDLGVTVADSTRSTTAPSRSGAAPGPTGSGGPPADQPCRCGRCRNRIPMGGVRCDDCRDGTCGPRCDWATV